MTIDSRSSDRLGASRGTAYTYQILYHVMQQLGLSGAGAFIVYLLAVTAAYDEAGAFEELQMMGQGRRAHVHHDGKIADTFLAVAQYPEQPRAVPVAKLSEYLRYGCKFFCLGHMIKAVLEALTVVMGQYLFFHIYPIYIL